MTNDLVAFLQARLDSTARKAMAAGGDRWTASAERFSPRVTVGQGAGDWWDRETSSAAWQCDDPADGCADVAANLMAEAEHIAANDPAWVLAEVDAKRRIIDECAEVLSRDDWEYTDAPELAEVTLLMLALPYRDHPDYWPEWALEA